MITGILTSLSLAQAATGPNINTVIIAITSIVLIIAVVFFTVNFIKKQRESQRRIKMMTNIDEVTHLYKRKFFDNLFESELARAKRHKRHLSCAIIEIDNFDKLTEKFGREFIDSVLQDTGEIFTDDTRIHDICARYNDSSFISIMPETDVDSSGYVCKRLRGLIEGSNFVEEETNKKVRVTVSIGLTSYEENSEDVTITTNDILAKADNALQKAKASGGNTVELFKD